MEELTKVNFSNLGKVMYPGIEATKGDVIEYYIRIAPLIIPHLAHRSLVLNRFPDGVDSEGFYEKDSPAGKPEWVKTWSRYSKSADREISYVVCEDLDTLIWLANMAALEIHIPLSRIYQYDNPDIVFFDIDPEPPADIDDAIEVAHLLKDELGALGYTSYVKTSGKKGLHVIIPIKPEYNYRQVREFVHKIGIHLSKKTQLIVSERSETDKPGTVLIDYTQNHKGRTMVAPYSLRAVRGAPVSTPLSWDELEDMDPLDYNLSIIKKRKEDPWEGIWGKPQDLMPQ
jgi:bifunctional non-homologous end joining protein LigD